MLESNERIKDTLAGAFSGLVTRMLTAPFDVMKIRYQVNCQETYSKSLPSAMLSIARNEGVTSLWKGNVPALYLWMSYSFVQFGAYGALKDQQTLPMNHFFAGGIAGCAATLVTYPFDLMRTQFAIQGKHRLYTSLYSFIHRTFHSKGILGFYSGLTPSLVQVAPYMGLNFYLYEIFRHHHQNEQILQSHYLHSLPLIHFFISHGLAGGLAGGLSKFLVYPLDTVKRRLQLQALDSTLTHSNTNSSVSSNISCASSCNHNSQQAVARQKLTMRQCVVNIYQYEGLPGFYRGLVPTLWKATTSTSMAFLSFEIGKRLLQNNPKR